MKITPKFQKFLSDRQGNIAMTFAIVLLPLTLSIGAAVDYSQSSQLKTRIADATDAALLASSSSILNNVDLDNKATVERLLKKYFEPFLMANMPVSHRIKYNGYKISYSPKTGDINVDVMYDFRTSVLGITGMDKLNIDAASSTHVQKSAGGAVSMFLVLDKSGSMGWPADKNNWSGPTKMDALKIAVKSMSNQFETIDPKHNYVRMGAVSYDWKAQKELKLRWGTTAADNYVQRLRAGGGTDSANAVKKAYNALKHPRENQEHQKKSKQDPTKVMVFMTDGSNNKTKSDRKTIKTCTQAKKNKIEIYTVAFLAPHRGQQLLKACASDSAHYFNATNASDLIMAFKEIGASVGTKLVLTK